jgi:hypothetical protein
VSTLFQQADYGGFDPKFLGINLRFHPQNLGAWDLFREINRHADDPEWMIAAGNAALAGNEDAALDFFSLATVMPHELRHFHDFLLSPYGNCLFRKRVHAALNSTQLVVRLMQEYDTIPVPFPRWQAKSDAERLHLAQMLGGMMGRAVPSEALRVPADMLRVWEQLQSLYGEIRGLLENPRNQWDQPDRLHPSHVFEASALATQLQSVYNTFGAEHATFFLNAVCRGDRHPFELYARLATLWHERGEPADSNVMGAVLAWSILGDPTHDGWGASPVPRFARVFMKLYKEGPPPAARAVELFDAWDAEFGGLPFREALERNASLNALMIERLDGLIAANGDDPLAPSVAGLVESMRMLERAHRAAATRFLADPDLYTKPWQYQSSIHDWVAAPIAAEFLGGGLHLTSELDSDLKVVRAIERKDRTLLVQRAIFPHPTPGQRLIDEDTASDTAIQFMISDFFFSDFRRDDPDFEPVRRTFSSETHRFPEILM